MTLTALEFRNHIKFKTIWFFHKQHAAVCKKGTFEPDKKWKSSNTQKKVCTVCGAVALIRINNVRGPTAAVKRAAGTKVSNEILGETMVFEGYIKKSLLGVEHAPDMHKKTKLKCVGCESWCDAEKVVGDLCTNCRNDREVASSVDYEAFYHEDLPWQNGQIHEVNSRKIWVPPIPEEPGDRRHINCLRFMVMRGAPEPEIREAALQFDLTPVQRLAALTRALELSQGGSK